MPTERRIKRVFYNNNVDSAAVENANRSIRVDDIDRPRENDNPVVEHKTQQDEGLNESTQEAESQVHSEQHSHESTETLLQQEVVQNQAQISVNASNLGQSQNQSEMPNEHQMQIQSEQKERHQQSEHQEIRDAHSSHLYQQAYQQTKQHQHGRQWQQDNQQQRRSSGLTQRLYPNGFDKNGVQLEAGRYSNTNVRENTSYPRAQNQQPPPKLYSPVHAPPNNVNHRMTWQCGKCYQTYPSSVTTCPCVKRMIVHGSKDHSDQMKAFWRCTKCLKVYHNSLQTCPCVPVIHGSAYSDNLNTTNGIWQRRQSNQPQMHQQPGYHQHQVRESFMPPKFQPQTNHHKTPVPNHVGNQRQQQHHPQQRQTHPKSNQYEPPATNVVQPQFRPDSNRALVDLPAGNQVDGQRSSKYFKQSTVYQAPPRGKQASQSEQLRQPSRGKQASHVEQLRHKSTSNNSRHDGSRQSGSSDIGSPATSQVAPLGVRNRKFPKSLIRSIEDAESLPQLEGIRHNLKMLLEKVEDKINRALVQQALDEFENANEHDASVSNHEPIHSPLQRVSCCPRCFSFEDIPDISSSKQPKKQDFATCPICESSICQGCQSKCTLCERICCFDCIHEYDGIGQGASLCRDCGGKTRTDSTKKSQEKTHNVNPSNAMSERKRKQPTETKAQEKRAKSIHDGPKQPVLEKHADSIHGCLTVTRDKPKQPEPESQKKASYPSTGTFDHQPSSGAVSDASTITKLQREDVQPASGISSGSGSSSFLANHIFVIQHEGPMGMNISADPKNKYAIIKSIEASSPADLYGLKCGDRILHDTNNPKITYTETRDWVINRLKSRPALLAVARKCIGEDGAQEPIFALASDGEKRYLNFDGDVRASIHRFVFKETSKLGLAIGEVLSSKGYTYTYVESVEPGSIAEQHGVRKADIVCKQTNEGRLISGLQNWILGKINSKPPFRFEVVRIHKVCKSSSRINEPSVGKEHNPPASLKKPDQEQSGPSVLPVLPSKEQPKTLSKAATAPPTSTETTLNENAPSSQEGQETRQKEGVAGKSSPRPALADKPENTTRHAAASPKGSDKGPVEENVSYKEDSHDEKYDPEPEGEGAMNSTTQHLTGSVQGSVVNDTRPNAITGAQRKSDTLTNGTESSQAVGNKPVDIKFPVFKIGTQLWKKFLDEKNGKRRPFSGKIQSYDAEEGFYKIVYEDGDEEELTEKQVAKLAAKSKKKDDENRPLLIGKLSRIEQDGKCFHAIRGYWHFDRQQRIASQTFELVRSVPTDTESPADEQLPASGEYPGSFVLEWIDQNTKQKSNTTIKEGNVVIDFERQDENGTTFSVKGKGLNQYGIFELSGLAIKDPGSYGKVFNVQMYKQYVNPNAAN